MLAQADADRGSIGRTGRRGRRPRDEEDVRARENGVTDLEPRLAVGRGGERDRRGLGSIELDDTRESLDGTLRPGISRGCVVGGRSRPVFLTFRIVLRDGGLITGRQHGESHQDGGECRGESIFHVVFHSLHGSGGNSTDTSSARFLARSTGRRNSRRVLGTYPMKSRSRGLDPGIRRTCAVELPVKQRYLERKEVPPRETAGTLKREETASAA